MNVLVIGLGSAGRRHARLAHQHGATCVATVDSNPRLRPTYGDLDTALAAGSWDVGVIATPPDLHVAHALECLQSGVQVVLIEKPLCGFGQIEAAEKLYQFEGRVALAYNYRFHPAICFASVAHRAGEMVHLSSRQNRSEPSWGFLLENGSHALDIVTNCLMGGFAHVTEVQSGSGWFRIEGASTTVKSMKFGIEDRVAPDLSRSLVLSRSLPDGATLQTRIPRDVGMFHRMWRELRRMVVGRYFPKTMAGLRPALRVQELLEEAAGLITHSETYSEKGPS